MHCGEVYLENVGSLGEEGDVTKNLSKTLVVELLVVAIEVGTREKLA